MAQEFLRRCFATSRRVDTRTPGPHTCLTRFTLWANQLNGLHMRNLHRAGILLSSLWLAPHAVAATNDVADNFRLTDHQGVSHELYYLSDMKAVVLLAQ